MTAGWAVAGCDPGFPVFRVFSVIPAQAGIQQDKSAFCFNALGSGLRRNDGVGVAYDGVGVAFDVVIVAQDVKINGLKGIYSAC